MRCRSRLSDINKFLGTVCTTTNSLPKPNNQKFNQDQSPEIFNNGLTRLTKDNENIHDVQICKNNSQMIYKSTLWSHKFWNGQVKLWKTLHLILVSQTFKNLNIRERQKREQNPVNQKPVNKNFNFLTNH